MTMAGFFNSYIGMFVSQAFCHSVTASIISDQALRAWNVADPGVRQRFRLLVVIAPVFSFPLYQAFEHSRSSIEFRQHSLFNINGWLNTEVWGLFPVGAFFLAMLAVTTLIFVFQEMAPVLIHLFQEKDIERQGARLDPPPFMEAACAALSLAVPGIVVIEDDELIVYSSTGRKPIIFVSDGLLRSLTPGQFEAALAHELGHIARSRRPVLLIVFILRIAMFFNPVSLVEFRRAVRNEEKICDDIAVSLTNRPEALADVLKKFFPLSHPADQAAADRPRLTRVQLEERSHAMQLESRISRLNAGKSDENGRWLLFAATVLIVAAINYFVV